MLHKGKKKGHIPSPHFIDSHRVIVERCLSKAGTGLSIGGYSGERAVTPALGRKQERGVAFSLGERGVLSVGEELAQGTLWN